MRFRHLRSQYWLSVFFVIILSACIKIDMTQVVDAAGKMQYTIVYDLTRLAEISEGMRDSTSSSMASSQTSSASSAPNDDCAAFAKKQAEDPNPVLKNAQCTDKAPHIIELKGSTQLSRKQLITRKAGGKTVYLYRLSGAMNFLNSEKGITQKQSSSVSPYGEEAGKELGKSIIHGTISITMPGRIIQSPVGKIAGNTVILSLSDFPVKRDGFIRSEAAAGSARSSAQAPSGAISAPKIPEMYKGVFHWENMSIPQYVTLNIEKTNIMRSGDIAFTGWHIYTMDYSKDVLTIPVRGTINAGTRHVRILEIRAPTENFVNSGSFEGTISPDQQTIDLVWTTKETGQKGSITFQAQNAPGSSR